jgi:hypothetical protein
MLSGTTVAEWLLLGSQQRPSTLNPIAGKCVLIVDGRRMPDAACAIDVEGGDEVQPFGFLSASFDVLKEAQLARRVEVELDDGRIVSISLLQVHSTGIALIAMARER